MASQIPLTLLGPLPEPLPRPGAQRPGALPQPGVLPPSAGEPELTALYDSTPLGLRTTGLRVQANMVTTVDGRTRGNDGLSCSISSPADKRVFSVLRALASAVVVGAGTVRAERYTRLSAKPAFAAARAARGQADAPVLVIISDSGRLDVDRLNAAGTSPVVVHVGATASPAVLEDLRTAFGAEAVVAHGAPVTPRAVLADLRDRGLTRIVHEGGPKLLGQWVAAGTVDELCLTVSGQLAGSAPAGAAARPGAAAPLLGSTVLDAAVGTTVRSVLSDGRTLIYRLGLDG